MIIGTNTNIPRTPWKYLPPLDTAISVLAGRCYPELAWIISDRIPQDSSTNLQMKYRQTYHQPKVKEGSMGRTLGHWNPLHSRQSDTPCHSKRNHNHLLRLVHFSPNHAILYLPSHPAAEKTTSWGISVHPFLVDRSLYWGREWGTSLKTETSLLFEKLEWLADKLLVILDSLPRSYLPLSTSSTRNISSRRVISEAILSFA